MAIATENVSYKGLAWIAASAFFMQTLDSTILNTALPAISADIHESPLEMQMAVISYALTIAALIPLSGWLADKFGMLKIFRLAVVLFVLGSICCAMSQTLEILVLTRIFQGIGGALMMPVARLTIIRIVPKSELVATWNTMAMAGLIGPILGPIVGGWLATFASWHWIFLINIPMGILGIYISGKYMPNLTQETEKFDFIGFLLFAFGLVSFTFGLELIGEDLNNSFRALLIIAIGLLLMAIYIFYAKRAINPILSLSLFKTRTFSIGMIANLINRLCNSGVPFLVPLMLQVSFGYRADLAGLLLAPIAVGAILAKSVVGKILMRLGYKYTLISGAIAMSVIIFTLGFMDKQTPIWLLVLILFINGMCNSIIFTSINTLTIADLKDKEASAGSTFLSAVQQVGIGFGIAVASVILALYRKNYGEQGEQLQQAFSSTFFTVSIFGLLLALFLLFLNKTDGDNLRSQKNRGK
ncbi:DHA2 family efflux MFS transporter permease subunit [Mannheimia sp. E15BD]|uniref:DHA2 family efflux MFS transporter permease subunit n=1 Tax=Mannheimia sp. E15BD TaxID=3278706 RepID=UPI00359D947E